ncbi:DUF1330 domain-containing protein [uncultured Nitratireductor sp.]|uniref:DUF1330 domain-containing protein n=1 Tax=uncultured Nitratireductor sp. TaxID=520953 RepID=UPI0025F626D0|nr:DUF1330 domain-containing protein [uncultured Nitratireductor sp.]
MSTTIRKGYWIAMVDIADPEGYKKYIDANAKAFEKYGARFLARGGQHTDPEGPAGDRQVIVEFSSYEQALACYHSPEYQEALAFRLANSTARFTIIEGV